MSLTSFALTAEKHPRLGDPIRAIGRWVEARDGVRFIELRRLARDLIEYDPVVLALALTAVEDDGYIRQAVRVKDPSGVLLPETYESPHEVPGRLDRADGAGSFDITHGEFVTGYLLEAGRVPA